MKINAKDNPLEMSVYKCNGKDGKGAWFARRSVHEGLGFEKWKRGLKREFPETMKVQGGPGEGGIRGIGGERRVEYRDIEGVGKLEGWSSYLWDGNMLIGSSVSAFSTVPRTYSPSRLCYHVLDLGSSIERPVRWEAGHPTAIHSYLETLHTPRYPSKRRLYPWSI